MYVYTCGMYIFSVEMPNGGHGVPFWGLWAAMLEDNLKIDFLKKFLLLDPLILLLRICPY